MHGDRHLLGVWCVTARLDERSLKLFSVLSPPCLRQGGRGVLLKAESGLRFSKATLGRPCHAAAPQTTNAGRPNPVPPPPSPGTHLPPPAPAASRLSCSSPSTLARACCRPPSSTRCASEGPSGGASSSSHFSPTWSACPSRVSSCLARRGSARWRCCVPRASSAAVS